MKIFRIVWVIAIAVVIVYCNDLILDFFLHEREVAFNLDCVKPFELIWLCVFTPFTEEWIFREAAYKVFRPCKRDEMDFMILIGIVFGWLHGSFEHIFIQGVAGIAFGYVYLKNGYSYLSAVAAHSLYNFLVAFAIPNISQSFNIFK